MYLHVSYLSLLYWENQFGKNQQNLVKISLGTTLPRTLHAITHTIHSTQHIHTSHTFTLLTHTIPHTFAPHTTSYHTHNTQHTAHTFTLLTHHFAPHTARYDTHNTQHTTHSHIYASYTPFCPAHTQYTAQNTYTYFLQIISTSHNTYPIKGWIALTLHTITHNFTQLRNILLITHSKHVTLMTKLQESKGKKLNKGEVMISHC